MAWSFNGQTIIPLRSNNITPDWRAVPRLDIRPLVGTGRTEVNNSGVSYFWRGTIRITSSAVYDQLMSDFADSTSATLTDGSTSWTAILTVFNVVPIADGLAGYEGEVEFIRPDG